MNWDDMQLFEAAARMRGISAASRTLGLSQPQMSRRLRRFEDRIGAQLFDRTPNGLMLTPAGERLLPLAAEMRKVADGVKRVQPELASDARRVVRISLDEVREKFLLDHAPWLREQLPGLDIEFFSGHVHLDHATRETDIQIRSCMPESDTLVAKRLCDIVYGVYRSSHYRAPPGCHPFSDPNWIGLSSDRLWYPEIRQWMADHVEHSAKLKVNTISGMKQAIQSGGGYGVLPRFLACRDPDLVAVDGLTHVYISHENLIVHRDLLRDKTIRRAVDVLCHLYRKNQAVLSGDNVAEMS
ncbi:MAG: LysR family transcriptional regulator [Stappiaceae bacterium]